MEVKVTLTAVASRKEGQQPVRRALQRRLKEQAAAVSCG